MCSYLQPFLIRENNISLFIFLQKIKKKTASHLNLAVFSSALWFIVENEINVISFKSCLIKAYSVVDEFYEKIKFSVGGRSSDSN